MLAKCDELSDVTTPIADLRISWSDMQVDTGLWSPLSVPSSASTSNQALLEQVEDHPLYPMVLRETLMGWSARLGAELAISRYVGNEAYNRVLMGRHPVIAYIHRAQLDINGLRMTFLRDDRAALRRLVPDRHQGQAIQLATRIPRSHAQRRSAKLMRLRQDERIIKEHYGRLAMTVANHSGIAVDNAAMQEWLLGTDVD